MIWFALPAALSSAYWILALVAAIRRLREPRTVSDFTPPVSILKPIRGRDDRFYEAIESHARQDYPAFEILFGVRDPNDPALSDIRRLMANYPRAAIRIVSQAPETPNGKAGMLIALAREARHPVLLVNDSDIAVEPDYLRTVVGPLEDPSIGLVTALYHASGSSFPARFEALGVATDFMPSVLVARMIGVAEFAMGSTMAFRAEVLREIGGFESVASYLADDYQLGARITATGRRVVLADCAVATHLGAGSWSAVWKHQVRWSRTIRVSRTSGYAGSAITHATFWSLVALAAGQWPFAVVAMALRLAAGWAGARAAGARNIPWWLVPLRDLFGSAVWAAGLFGSTVEWRGEKLELSPDGKIK